MSRELPGKRADHPGRSGEEGFSPGEEGGPPRAGAIHMEESRAPIHSAHPPQAHFCRCQKQHAQHGSADEGSRPRWRNPGDQVKPRLQNPGEYASQGGRNPGDTPAHWRNPGENASSSEGSGILGNTPVQASAAESWRIRQVKPKWWNPGEGAINIGDGHHCLMTPAC